jgi:KUP system potassium uptake protein
MLMTSILLFIAMREIWKWSLVVAGAVAGCFFIVDASFFLSNMTKISDGGYVPLAIGAIVLGLMYIWHKGMLALNAHFAAAAIPLPDFFADLEQRSTARVPGTAVFLTRAQTATPPIIVWHVRASRSLHQQVLAITCIVESVPYVSIEKRLTVEEVGPNFWRVIAHYGFMQRPNVPGIACSARDKDPRIDLSDVVYYIGTETAVPSKNRKQALPRWQEAIFAAMDRNEAQITEFVQLPAEQVVQIGRQVPI